MSYLELAETNSGTAADGGESVAGSDSWRDERGADDDNDESRGLLNDDDDDEGVHVVKMDHAFSGRPSVLIGLLIFVALMLGGGLSARKSAGKGRDGVPLGKEDLDDVTPSSRTGDLDAAKAEATSSQGSLSAIKQRQVANYVNGSALILSVHITHHAGTSVCAAMKTVGPSPAFACMGPGKKAKGPNSDTVWPEGANNLTQGARTSWTYNETAVNVQILRPYFHFFSQEYSNRHRGLNNLHETFWEYENLVSMIVMRDPIERFLASGKCGEFHEGKTNGITADPTNETQALYWKYANSKCADNYALNVLTEDPSCVDGGDTSVDCLESAKALLRRFTFIVDQHCLDDSMVALGLELNLNITKNELDRRKHKVHPTDMSERIGNETLHEFLRHRFRRDIELYEWSKERSIVQCDRIRA